MGRLPKPYIDSPALFSDRDNFSRSWSWNIHFWTLFALTVSYFFYICNCHDTSYKNIYRILALVYPNTAHLIDFFTSSTLSELISTITRSTHCLNLHYMFYFKLWSKSENIILLVDKVGRKKRWKIFVVSRKYIQRCSSVVRAPAYKAVGSSTIPDFDEYIPSYFIIKN